MIKHGNGSNSTLVEDASFVLWNRHYNYYCQHWFYTKKRKNNTVSSGVKMLHITLSTDLIAGIGRILTGTCAEAQVKKGIWSIGFLITTL